MPISAPGWFQRLTLPAALCTFAAACAPFEFEAQELFLHHDVEHDALELGIVYEGLICGDMGEDPLATSVDAIGRIAAGERYFILLGWPFVFDLDTPQIEFELEDLPSELEPRVRDWMSSIRITESALFRDEHGHLGALQRLRWENASAGIATLNSLISHSVVESLEEDGAEDEDEDLDARTRNLMLGHAKSGKPWVLLTRGGIELRVPMSRSQAARQLASLARPPDDDDLQARRMVADLLAPLSEIAFANELLVLRFLPNEAGRVELRFTDLDSPYEDRLQSALEEEQIEVTPRTLAWARERAQGQ